MTALKPPYSFKEYKDTLDKKLENLDIKIEDFISTKQEKYEAPTADLTQIIQGKHAKIKIREIEEIKKEDLVQHLQNIKNDLKDSITSVLIKTEAEYQFILEQNQSLINQKAKQDTGLSIAQDALGSVEIEVKKLAHLFSKDSNLPQECFKKIFAALNKAEHCFFDVEHNLIDRKIVTDSQDHTSSDITDDYVSVDSSAKLGIESVTPLGKGLFLFDSHNTST